MTIDVVHNDHSDTQPNGVPVPAASAQVTHWRRAAIAIDEQLQRTADAIDASDPDFDHVADIAAAELLRAGSVLDLYQKRHARAVADAERTTSGGPQ
jgi:hypothetical protein